MKRFGIVLLSLVLALCLCACGGVASPFTQEYTLPEGTAVLGVDLTGFEKEDAWAVLESAVQEYTLQLNVDGVDVAVAGKDFDLSCSREVFMAGADALEAGGEADFSQLIHYNDMKLRLALGRVLNKPVVEAAIVYDEAAGAYILQPHAEGLQTDHNALAGTLREVIRSLTPTHTCTGFAEILTPVWQADSEQALKALDKVNLMANTQLSYHFGTEADPLLHQIPVETIRSFISLGEDGFTPTIDPALVEPYVAELAQQYDTAPHTGDFITSGGEELGVVISYYGCYLNGPALVNDIVLCASWGYNGSRDVPYQPGSVRGMPFGGTYVEVNLDDQHMWFYKDGQLLTDSDLVSGNVAAGHMTPTGIFRIYSRTYSTYLVGADYRSWVNYWMPFSGGYGLHDANWRSEFGGDIYLTDGSHGCVNLPHDVARTLIQNSRSGDTRVVIYGGERHNEPMEQSFKGETEYDVAEDAEPFKLNVRSRYEWPDYYYECDDTDVITVDEDGYVTVNGIGTATVTVTCTTEGYRATASTTATVTVHSTCDEGRHVLGQPEVTTAPTCVAGVETTRCTKCDYFEEKELKPVDDHTPGQWAVTEEATCQEKGKQVLPCTVCGKELEEESIEKLEHSYADGVCTACGDADPDFSA